MRPYGLTPHHRTLRSDRASHRAFTLVELLVVFGIIAILASLLFPAFAYARKSARRTVCVSNLHQTGMAFAMYQQDNDGGFPAAAPEIQDTGFPANYFAFHDGFCEGSVAEETSWTDIVLPYVGKRAPSAQSVTSFRPTSPIFFCPADTNPPGRLGLMVQSEGTPATSYAYKMWLGRNHFESQVPKPDQMALLWEQKDYHNGGSNNDFARVSEMNVLFADDHVRWKHMADATTATLSPILESSAQTGPDLNLLFDSPGHEDYYGVDFMN